MAKLPLPEPLHKITLQFGGIGSDMTEPYFWHINNGGLHDKSYKALKIEDIHYFSDASRAGQEGRQLKGNSIRVFTDTMEKITSLVKNVLYNLVDEIRRAETFKKQFDDIEISSIEIKKAQEKKDEKAEQEAKKKLHQAIITMKYLWIDQVDKGRLWQIASSSGQMKLNYNQIPRLFINLDIVDPLNEETMSDQLKNLTLPVQTTTDVQDKTIEYLYRFYTWLVPSIKKAKMTYKLRLISLKQIYSRIKLDLQLVKPLLKEIFRRNERFSFESFYKGYESMNPEMTNLLNNSYSYIHVLFIKELTRELESFEKNEKGVLVQEGDIISGKYKGKKGHIVSKEENEYVFLEEDKDEEVKVKCEHFKKYACVSTAFTQTRSPRVIKTQQGPGEVFYHKNEIEYTSYIVDVYDIATLLMSIQEEDFELLGKVLEEVEILKDDILHYLQESDQKLEKEDKMLEEMQGKNKKKKKSPVRIDEDNMFVAPFLALKELGSLFTAFIPEGKKSDEGGSKEKKDNDVNVSDEEEKAKINAINDMWSMYTQFKETHGYPKF